MIHFDYLQTEQQLKEKLSGWKEEKQIAIDLECENNLHHFGTYISLIQLSTVEKNVIIDVLAIKNIKPVVDLLENQNIEKVLHDINFDLRILAHQFSCQMKNFFDTQLAAEFLGKQKISLASLLGEYFNIQKDERFQKKDWTRRPISQEMLAYAIKDAAHLFSLKEKLEAELQQKNRLFWVQQELKYLETLHWEFNEQTYMDVSGVRSLAPKERALFHALFEARKKIAQEIDKPAFIVFSNKQLLAFAKNPPHTWKLLKGVHPLVKQRSSFFEELVKKASLQEEHLEKKDKKHFSSEQYESIQKLLELRNKIAEKMGIKSYLLLREEQIRDIAATGSLHNLRPWQKEIFMKEKMSQIIAINTNY